MFKTPIPLWADPAQVLRPSLARHTRGCQFGGNPVLAAALVFSAQIREDMRLNMATFHTTKGSEAGTHSIFASYRTYNKTSFLWSLYLKKSLRRYDENGVIKRKGEQQNAASFG